MGYDYPGFGLRTKVDFSRQIYQNCDTTAEMSGSSRLQQTVLINKSGDSSTYNTEDYEHRGGAQWLMADTPHIHNAASLAAIGSTTRPDGSSPEVGQPKYRFIPSGHLIINI